MPAPPRKAARPRRRRIPLLGAAAFVTAALIAATAQLTTASTAEEAPGAEPVSAAAPAQWLTGYWHNFDNGSTTLTIGEVPSRYNLIAVAFADNHPSLSGGITFNLQSQELGGYGEARFKADIAAAQAEGRKVILSVGGELGNVSVANATQARNFADTSYALMQEYGFDGIDIDLEHGINAQYLTQALRSLHEQAGPDLIITMAPQTIDFQGPEREYYRLAQNISDILTIVNMQYYNSGSMLGCDGRVHHQATVDFVAALACIQLEMGLRPDQVGLGLPSVPQAAPAGGYLQPSQIVRVLDCLEAGTDCAGFSPQQPYGPIGGVMTWSINWDATNGYAFAEGVGPRLGGEPGSGPTAGPTDEPTDAPTGAPGECAAAPWSAGTVYTGGDQVSHNGAHYRAQWWTQGEEPGTTGPWGVWEHLGTC